NLRTADFTDTNYWESLGNPIKYIVVNNFIPAVTTYLDSNFGLDNNLVDSWSQATSEGQKTTLAGAITVLDFNSTAQALIKSGAQINQPAKFGDPIALNGSQTVTVE